jgi:hypothetical protein
MLPGVPATCRGAGFPAEGVSCLVLLPLQLNEDVSIYALRLFTCSKQPLGPSWRTGLLILYRIFRILLTCLIIRESQEGTYLGKRQQVMFEGRSSSFP